MHTNTPSGSRLESFKRWDHYTKLRFDMERLLPYDTSYTLLTRPILEPTMQAERTFGDWLKQRVKRSI